MKNGSIEKAIETLSKNLDDFTSELRNLRLNKETSEEPETTPSNPSPPSESTDHELEAARQFIGGTFADIIGTIQKAIADEEESKNGGQVCSPIRHVLAGIGSVHDRLESIESDVDDNSRDIKKIRKFLKQMRFATNRQCDISAEILRRLDKLTEMQTPTPIESVLQGSDEFHTQLGIDYVKLLMSNIIDERLQDFEKRTSKKFKKKIRKAIYDSVLGNEEVETESGECTCNSNE